MQDLNESQADEEAREMSAKQLDQQSHNNNHDLAAQNHNTVSVE